MQPNDKIKDFVKSVSDLCVLCSDVSQGFSFKEATELVSVVQDVSLIAGEAPEILSQYEALDPTSQADVHLYIASLSNFPANAKVDSFVKKALQVGVALSAALQAYQGN